VERIREEVRRIALTRQQDMENGNSLLRQRKRERHGTACKFPIQIKRGAQKKKINALGDQGTTSDRGSWPWTKSRNNRRAVIAREKRRGGRGHRKFTHLIKSDEKRATWLQDWKGLAESKKGRSLKKLYTH